MNKMNNIKNKAIHWRKKYVSSETKEIKSVSKRFYKDDVLYGRLRPYLNKVYLANKPIEEGLCSNEFIVLTCKEAVLPEFLRTILTSPLVLDKVSSMQAGAALPRIGSKDLLDIVVPIPPIEIQRDLVREINSSNKKYEEALKLVKKLPKEIVSDFTQALQG